MQIYTRAKITLYTTLYSKLLKIIIQQFQKILFIGVRLILVYSMRSKNGDFLMHIYHMKD